MIPTWSVHMACSGDPDKVGDRRIREIVQDLPSDRLYYLVEDQEPATVWLVNDRLGRLWTFCGCGAFLAPKKVVKWHNTKQAEHLGRRDNTP